MIRASDADVAEQVDKLLSREKTLEHEVQRLKDKLAQAEAGPGAWPASDTLVTTTAPSAAATRMPSSS